MLIDIVAHHHVHQPVVPDELAQLVQGLVQGGHIHPVVRVHYLIVNAPGVADALVHALAVAAVLLVDGPDDVGVLLLIPVADGRGLVFGGAVVHQNDLNVVAPLQQGVHAVLHVGRRVVTGDGKGDQLIHVVLSLHLAIFRAGLSSGPRAQSRSARSRARAAMASIL